VGQRAGAAPREIVTAAAPASLAPSSNESFRTNFEQSYLPQRDDSDAGPGVQTQDGLVIIDDNIRPDLRGRTTESVAARDGGQDHELSTPTLLPSAVDPFPELAPAAAVQSSPHPPRLPARARPSRTLRVLARSVAPYDPVAEGRMRKARDEARQKLLLQGQVGFGSTGAGMMRHCASAPNLQDMDKRNRRLAEALSVDRMEPCADDEGEWGRPASPPRFVDSVQRIIRTEVTDYPDAFIESTRDSKMDICLRLEKTWKPFLRDGRTASHQFVPMERSDRKFVHTYAAFWSLHTESFVANQTGQKNKYVSCVKLPQTRAPFILLSKAVADYRGPRPKPPPISQPPPRAEGATLDEEATEVGFLRTPLALLPRTLPPGTMMMDSESIRGASFSIPRIKPMTENGRGGLGKERIKLRLDARGAKGPPRSNNKFGLLGLEEENEDIDGAGAMKAGGGEDGQGVVLVDDAFGECEDDWEDLKDLKINVDPPEEEEDGIAVGN